MFGVSKLVTFFESLSGGSAQPPQTDTSHHAQYGILPEEKTPIPLHTTIAERSGSTAHCTPDDAMVGSKEGLGRRVTSMISSVYDRIPNFFGPEESVQKYSSLSVQVDNQYSDIESQNNAEHLKDTQAYSNWRDEVGSDRLSQVSQREKDGRHIEDTSCSGKPMPNLADHDKTKSTATLTLNKADSQTDGEEKNVKSRSESTSDLPRFSSLLEEGHTTVFRSLSESADSILNTPVSTPSESYHTGMKPHDKNHDNEENMTKDSQPKSRTTSGTSGYFSRPSAMDSTVSDQGIKDRKVESKEQSTGRYVQETFASRPIASSLKYPSEPTLKQQQLTRSRARTQENIFNINGSNVSIFSSDESRVSESFHASQLSVFSLEQETREVIADQTEGLLAAHANCTPVPESRRLKKAKKVLKEEGVVIIVDKNGSGSSHLGWDVFLADNSKEKYNVIDVQDLPACLHSKGSVAVFVDDAIENDLSLDICLRYIKTCRKTRSSRSVTCKLIFTVKYHIYNQHQSRLSDYGKCIVDIEYPSLQLDSNEMVNIMRAMIANNGEKMKVDLTTENDAVLIRKKGKRTTISDKFLSDISEVALPSGFPKRFLQFLETKTNTRKGLEFFTEPTEELLEEIIGMNNSSNESDKEKALTLAMTVVFGGKITIEKVMSLHFNQHQTRVKPAIKKKKKHKRNSQVGQVLTQDAFDLPWWIEMIKYFSDRCTKSVFDSAKAGINALKGNYLKQGIKGVFSFTAPCVKNAVLISLGRDFPHLILKLCDQHFFQHYIRSSGDFEHDGEPAVKIDVRNGTVCSSANDFLLELIDNGQIEWFSKHRLLRDRDFLDQFFRSVEADRLWQISKQKDTNTRRCVISCSLDAQQLSIHFGLSNNFAYYLLSHKVWSQKRKVYKEWTTQMEKDVILDCCKRGHDDDYFLFQRKYNIPTDFDCLQAAVESGSKAIVDDILHRIGKHMSDMEKCKCMELALLKYTRQPLKSRHDVVDSLLRFVSVDYKISGIDPVLHTATKNGEARVIVTLEVFKGDINITNCEGKTCLHEAIQRNKAAFLLMALQHGADQRKADKDGALPIHQATKQNKRCMMKVLLGEDHEIASETDRLGRQPIHYAAIYNNVEAANLLIEGGVEVDACDFEENTPLHHAAASGRASVLHSLLKANADITKADRRGNSPLQIACKAGNEKGVKRLLQRTTRTELDEQNDCLFIAVEQNQPKILKMLLDKGLDINQKNEGGETLLCFAIEMNERLVPLLLVEEPDVNLPCKGRLPLHVAVTNGKRETFKTLIEAGANIEAATLQNNDTVLHIAVANGHDDLVYDILQMTDTLTGCRNRQREVPLHIAARNGNLSVTRALLARGAERSPINTRSQTPLCIVNEKLKELHDQKHNVEYKNYYSVMLLLEGHRVMLETAL